MKTIILNTLDARIVEITAKARREDAPFFGVWADPEGLSPPVLRETRVRVRSAIEHLGVKLNDWNVDVQVPRDLPPSGDLAVACAVLAAVDMIPGGALDDLVLYGELNLTGALRPVRGVLPALRKVGAGRPPTVPRDGAIIPWGNRGEGRLLPGLTYAAQTLAEVVAFAKTRAPALSGRVSYEGKISAPPRVYHRDVPNDASVTLLFTEDVPADAPTGNMDFADVRCSARTRRAVEIAAAGGHSLLLLGAAGAGKCLGRSTPVMSHNGVILPVETVRTGDKLMGPDGNPRTVMSTTSGVGPLYRIVPIKGTPWICNSEHILTLVHSSTSSVVDISISDFLQKNKTFRQQHKLFAPENGVDFVSKDNLPVDPHFLGLWYGDGGKVKSRAIVIEELNGVTISKPDPEVLTVCEEQAIVWGLRVNRVLEDDDKCPTYRLAVQHGGQVENPLLNALRVLYKDGNALPFKYLTSSRSDREAFLAGLLDSDGHLTNNCFEIVQKKRGWAEGICYLARSLGFRATMTEKVLRTKVPEMIHLNGSVYWRIMLSGDFTSLPMRIARKTATARKQKKRVTRTGFKVESVGVGEFFGFELNRDGRFLLGDFTVTHNSMLARRMPTIMAPMTSEERLLASSIFSVAGLVPDNGVVNGRPFRAPHFTVSTAGLLGGGKPVRPGEVSLAHEGVLFLDEFLEFKNQTLSDSLGGPGRRCGFPGLPGEGVGRSRDGTLSVRTLDGALHVQARAHQGARPENPQEPVPVRPRGASGRANTRRRLRDLEVCTGARDASPCKARSQASVAQRRVPGRPEEQQRVVFRRHQETRRGRVGHGFHARRASRS